MKKLPDTRTNWSALNELMSVGARRRVFIAALRLKVFDYIDSNDAQEIARRMSSHPRNTELFLNAIAGMGLIRKNNGEYSNTGEVEELLVSHSPTYLGDYLLHVGVFQEMSRTSLEDLVLTGPPDKGPEMGDESMWAESAKLAAAYQYCGEARRIADIVRAQPEFSNMSRMLDLGGGSGFYAMSVVGFHPSMSGVILEQPAVAEVAEKFIAEYGFKERISVIAGDYARDDLGGPYDLIFASATLNFMKGRLDGLFTKVHAALAPGGIFITHQDGITDERTRPVNHIAEFLMPELMGSDFALEQGDIAESMLRSGFHSVRSFTKVSSIGEMDVDIGRKAKAGEER